MFCTNCGDTLSEGARFCRTCGTQTGTAQPGAAPAETAASGAAPESPPQSAWWDPNAETASPPPTPPPLATPSPPPAWSATSPQPMVPAVELESQTPHARRRVLTGRVLVVVAGVVALALVLSWVVRSSGSGGASSAQSAADKVISAIRSEDPAALASMIAPDELADMHDLVKSAAGKGQALNLATSSSNPFAGVDINVTNPQTHVTTLADGYARIDLTGGTLSYTIDKSKLAPKVRNALSPDAQLQGSTDLGQFACANLNSEDETPIYCRNGGQGPFVIAVRESGRWYISPTYTGLEYWRIAQNLPAADFGSHKNAPHEGSDTPQQAVEAMANAIGSADVDTALSLLPPDEFQGVYDYRAAIHTALERGNAPTFLFSVNDGSSTTELDTPGGKKVVISAASGQYAGEDSDGNSARLPWSLQGSCLTTTDNEGNPSQSCASDAFSRLAGSSTTSSLSQLYVVTVQRGGKWYVSPSETIATYLRALITSLQPSDINLNDNSNNG